MVSMTKKYSDGSVVHELVDSNSVYDYILQGYKRTPSKQPVCKPKGEVFYPVIQEHYPDTIGEVVDCGVCGTLLLSWTKI